MGYQRNNIVLDLRDVKVNMENKINVTKKLLKIVKHRKTPVVVNKQENGYKKNRNVSRNLSYNSYSYDSDD